MTRLLNRLVIIDATGDRARITSPFPASPVIKAQFWRDRKWDVENKVWLVSHACLDSLIRDLVAAGFEVDYCDASGMHQAVTRVPAGWSA